MSYGVAGSNPFGVYTKFIRALVKDLIYAQYGLASPAKEDPDVQADRRDQDKVLIGTGWEGTGINKIYEIHCIETTPAAVQGRVNGYHRVKYRQDVEVHVWARNNGTTEQANLLKIIQEISRIATQFPRGLAQGAGPIFESVGWQDMNDPKDNSTSGHFHYMAIFGVLYDMASTA